MFDFAASSRHAHKLFELIPDRSVMLICSLFLPKNLWLSIALVRFGNSQYNVSFHVFLVGKVFNAWWDLLERKFGLGMFF